MKYKPLLLSSLGLIPAGMHPAAAAPPNVKPPQTIQYVPSWAGYYVGVNLGAVSEYSSATTFLPNAPFSYCFSGSCGFSNRPTAIGVLGGGQIGYNFQTGDWVYGLETDFDFASARHTTTGADTYAFAGNWTARTGIQDLGTVRLRLGYTFDRALIYATGGLAYGKVSDNFQAGNSGGATYNWSGDPGWRTGYTVGGGLEYALSQSLSIKGEGLFYDLGTKNEFTVLPVGANFGVTGVADHMNGVVGRIGLNYHFQ